VNRCSKDIQRNIPTLQEKLLPELLPESCFFSWRSAHIAIVRPPCQVKDLTPRRDPEVPDEVLRDERDPSGNGDDEKKTEITAGIFNDFENP